MQKNCSRCSKSFECITDCIDQCDCNTIQLSKTTKEYLAKTNYDCLCLNCLKEVENFNELKKQYPFPESPSKYVNGIHYYIEGNYWVFTTYFHYLKGSCCKNNCRHCAYGFTKKSI